MRRPRGEGEGEGVAQAPLWRRLVRRVGAPIDFDVGTAAGASQDGRRMLTPDGRLRSGRLAGLSMGAAIWVLSWPVLAESFLNSLVGLTDTVLAAGLENGQSAADAIGAAAYITWFIGLIIMALSVGATAMVSRAVGKGRMALASAVLGQTIGLALVAGVATGVLIALVTPMTAGLLRLEGEAQRAFVLYMLVMAAGVPAASVLFTLIACARGAGDSKRPLWAMLARNAVNMYASWALSGAAIAGVECSWGPGLGVTGIALGTLLGDIVGSCVVLGMAIRGTWGIRLRRRRLAPHWHTIRRLIRLGVPNFFETFGMWVGNFLVIMMVAWIAGTGGGLLGAHVITIRIEAFSFLPGFAMGTAAAALAGQYIGGGSAALARRAITVCTLVAMGVMGVLGLLLVLIPAELTAMFTPQPLHREVVPELLYVIGFVQIPFAVSLVLRSAMRGAGDVRVVMWLTWATTYAVRLPLVYALSGVDIPLPGGGVIENPFGLDWGIRGVWIGQGLELVVRAGVFFARFAHGGWSRARV